jgi:hypothetical protein
VKVSSQNESVAEKRETRKSDDKQKIPGGRSGVVRTDISSETIPIRNLGTTRGDFKSKRNFHQQVIDQKLRSGIASPS